jgi:FkbM family methyltransferase
MTLFMGADHELDTLERVRAALEGRGVDPFTGRTIVDVGANIGTTTVGALTTLGMSRAVCLEPLPENLRLLRHNLLANGIADRAEVLDIALSDRPAAVEFEIHPGNPSDARVRVAESAGADDAFGESGWEVVTVATRTFDDLVEEGTIALEDLGLVWVDAQGHEGHILVGAGKLLAAEVPIVLEFWPYGLRRAGGLERLTKTIEANYASVVDLEDGAVIESKELGALASRLGHTGHTDILLLN